MALADKLNKIRSPKLQNQREVCSFDLRSPPHQRISDHRKTAIVLSAVEDTLKEQKCDFTPTAYFAALLALLSQSISSSQGIINKELATSVVYLLDHVTSYVPVTLLRTKFSQILTSLAPALNPADIEAPLLRSSIGCLESLLVAQDSAAWALPPGQVGPRRALAGLLTLAVDHRPKVRKRAQDAVIYVLKSSPPSPAIDHPAADMCAETALRALNDMLAANATKKRKAKGHKQDDQNTPGLMHALQLIKTIAGASAGWPSKKIEALCEVLMTVSRSTNEYLTMAALEIFEIMFAGMANESSSSKLPRMMEAISELRPSQNDSQLLPPWIAVVSRGCDVSAQVEPEETFQKLPESFELISSYLASASHSIRVSASECLISFFVNCVPNSVILEPSVYDEKPLEKLGKLTTNLLTVRFQAAWIEVFSVLSAFFTALRWRSKSIADEIIQTIGELRSNESFNGKKEADSVLGSAIEAMGPEAVLQLLPLNLANPKAGQPGRAWLLPVLRDHVMNTSLAHFRSEFVPLSETMFRRVLDHGDSEKTMQIKIFETLVQQIWALLPGYCSLPLDMAVAFDQSFAELLSNVLYMQTELRVDVCRALQSLVESNQELLSSDASASDLLIQRKMNKADAQKNLDHLSSFASNFLSVLFNVYGQTLPQFRGHILQCINAFLSITPLHELSETFTSVITLLGPALAETTPQTQASKQKQKQSTAEKMPSQLHSLMDLVVTISSYLPRPTYPSLFSTAALVLPQSTDPQLQKKAYKLLPRIATSPTGILALQERNADLQSLLLSTAASATSPCRHDRLSAIATVVMHLPTSDLHFIPSILSEVVISAKEVNEKARTAAFDLLILMATKMSGGGTIRQSKIPHMDASAPEVAASLEEFFTMVSAGLVGSTPHMVSASVTALTRILYEFHKELSKATVEDMLETIFLFLTSPSREIVRSVLGFVKVAIISLPTVLLQPRLQTVLPGLISWSREHKAQFRAKVKHILERAIRKFGYAEIERWTPEGDRKFLANIRKAKDRAKRKKAEGATDGHSNQREGGTGKNVFESEYDAAVYSDSDEKDEEASDADEQKAKGRGGGTYILEDSDSPLDLLDRKALGSISSSKPVRGKVLAAKRGKVNIDGKLVIGMDSDDDDDPMVLDSNGNGNSGEISLEGGINAYVDAIKGRDSVQRGRGGRLKFSNKREKGTHGEAMDVDDEGEGRYERPVKAVRFGNGANGTNGARGGGLSGGRGGPNGKKYDPKSQRRGLGMAKVRGGRVVKSGERKGKETKNRGTGGR
ncbi:MAG: hypothetical protein Q9195_001404 [Heterodermia aff. obscurata]